MADPLGKRVWVAGHRGMVGRAIVRQLEQLGDVEILSSRRDQLDLMDQRAVAAWLARERPDSIVFAAAKVGGILANDSYPAEFLYDNLVMASNVIDAAHKADVDRLLFLGSSCIYPKFATQPIKEDALLTGPLEPTNQWYAIAKIAGIKLVEAYRRQYDRDYISAMPTNLYGPFDNFDLSSSHVLPALLRKAHEAKVNRDQSLTVWGTGTPRREFLHVDDCANACLFLLRSYSGDEHVNVGSGDDLTILELAQMIREVVGLQSAIQFDTSKPDGTQRKLMSADKLRSMGWRPTISLRDGIESTYRWYLENQAT